MLKTASRADEYRARAAAATEAGAVSTLEHVRAKHAQAAHVWTDLAEAEDARKVQRAIRQSESPTG